MASISRRSFVVIAVAFVLSACTQVAERSESTPTTSLVVTDTVHHTDVQNREPMVAELGDGALLVTGFPRLPHLPARPPSLWKSVDDGRSWGRANAGSPEEGAGGNSDTDLAVAPDGTVYFVSMGFNRTSNEGTHITIGVSRDHALSWSWTYLAQNARVDRPWVEVAPDGMAHVIWNDGDGVYHTVSSDGGLTWEERPKVSVRGGSSHLAVGPNGELAVRITPLSASGGRYDADFDLLAVSTDRGQTWTRNAVPGTLDWENAGLDTVPRWVEPLAWDADGRLYHLWSEGREMWLGSSADNANTWTTWRIAQDNDVVFFPYLVARGSGELAATWFSSADGMSVRVAVIETGEIGTETQPHVVLSAPLSFESWMESDGEWMRDTAGEYVPVAFLQDGNLAVVTPLQDARANRFGFTWWRLELR